MLRLKKVAITGGLSSGKTTVSNLFGELGALVVSADEIVHELLSSNTPFSKQVSQDVLKLLGQEVEKNGQLDRTLIAKKVFQNGELLHKLEEILHPAVALGMQTIYESSKNQDYPLFVAEIPLLFEAGLENWFDAVITVVANQEKCMQRFRQKGGSEDEYFKRMKRQMSPAEKSKRSQFTLHNNGDLNELKSEVTQIFYALTQRGVAP